MPRALTDATVYLQAFPDSGLDSADPKLLRALELASQDLESECGRRFLTQSYARWHSGDRAIRFNADPGVSVKGDTLWLADRDSQGLMALAPVTAVSKIEEDGLAVPWVYATASSFPNGELAIVDADAGTIVRAYATAGRPARKAWAFGYSNIRVELTAGYTASPTASYTMPADIEQVCCELASLYLAIPQRSALQSIGEGGFNATLMHMLSKDALRIRDSYKLPRMPRTVE